MILPQFLSIADRQLHTVSFLPEGNESPEHWLLHLPAFAEEMNMCRQTVAMQARQLTEKGFGVLVFDYSGTGDSEGELHQSDWIQWKAEAEGMIHWLLGRGASSITLWGCRLGTLMAMDLSSEPELKPWIPQVLLWQPVLSGRQYVKQFLRHRLASGLWNNDDENRETIADLLSLLKQGERLEISGYTITYPLIEQLETLSLSSMLATGDTAVHWFETGVFSALPSPVTNKVLTQWRESGLSCQYHSVSGPPFWSVQANIYLPELLQQTSEAAVLPQQLRASASEFVKEGSAGQTQAMKSSGFSAFTFKCEGSSLVGLLDRPEKITSDIGVLIVAGGAQYRVGAHRLFVHMSQAFSEAGIVSMRFDYRGMGDSDGQHQGFEGVDSDIRAAVNELMRRSPQSKGVVLMGLCDGATAAAIYAPSDNRVNGLVLLNPWVHSEEGEAAAKIRHYYSKKLLHGDFWKKVWSGQVNIMESLSGFAQSLYLITRGLCRQLLGFSVTSRSLFSRVEAGLKEFDGRVALVLSGNDLTAAEFNDRIEASSLNDHCERRVIEGADHTLSSSAKKQELTDFVSGLIHGGYFL